MWLLTCNREYEENHSYWWIWHAVSWLASGFAYTNTPDERHGFNTNWNLEDKTWIIKVHWYTPIKTGESFDYENKGEIGLRNMKMRDWVILFEDLIYVDSEDLRQHSDLTLMMREIFKDPLAKDLDNIRFSDRYDNDFRQDLLWINLHVEDNSYKRGKLLKERR